MFKFRTMVNDAESQLEDLKYQNEMTGVNNVLDAAALTYVAAAAQSISLVLYYAMILLGGGRRR